LIKTEKSVSKSRLFRLFDVSKSGYYDWLNRQIRRQISARELVNDELDQRIERIERIYTQHNRCYGYRRVREELLDLGLSASRERVWLG
jgi:hypothetical protein